MKSSWKTTLAGVATLGLSLAGIFWPEYGPKIAAVSTAIAGSGLLFARDNDKSSEDVGADK
jgi:hypothetical protein